MSNKNILTYNQKVSQVEQMYFAPVAQLPAPYSQSVDNFYCFLSRVEPWDNDTNPPQPTQDQKYIKSVFNNMFVVKKISSNDISPVVQRVDWTPGVIYDYYRDDIDMFEKDNNGNMVHKFYVRNKYDQVFKCLWNNNDSASTTEPFFQPGNYDVNGIFTGADGYKWKYIYTVDIGLKTKFLDIDWMPVPVGQDIPNPYKTFDKQEVTAGRGNIPVINIINGGSGYDPTNSAITITITGDGIGASALAKVTDGVITEIIVTNSGSDYTYANVVITSTLGSNVSVLAPISPIGGHGFDPVSELGCDHVMLVCEFQDSENGYVPTEIDYRQVGIITNPLSLSTFPRTANGIIYKTTSDLVVASGFGEFQEDEIVYQGESLETASFKGTVLYFDPATDIINVINTVGTLTNNASIRGNTSKTVRTLLNYSTPDFIKFSGYLTYIENRSQIQRSSDGIEQFKFVLGY